MKVLNKSYALGIVLFIIGSAFSIFPQVDNFSTALLIISGIFLLKGIYDLRSSLWMHKKMLRHYQAILTTSDDIWAAWTSSGKIVGVSKQLKVYFKINEDKVSLDDLLDKLTDTGAQLLKDNFESLVQNGVGFSTTVSLKDKTLQFEVYGNKAIVHGVETYTLWFKNITQTAITIDRLSLELRDANYENNNLKMILDTISIPVWSRNQDMEITYCNKKYADMLSLSKESIIEKNIPLIRGGVFGQGHLLAESANKSNRPQFLSQSAVIGGMRRDMEVYEHPFASSEKIVGYALDVTNWQEAVTNFDKVISAHGSVLEALPLAVAIFDSDMKLTFYNSSYQKLTNFEENWLNSQPTYISVLDRQKICRQLPEYADFSSYKSDQIKMFSTLSAPTWDILHIPNGNVFRRLVAPYTLGGLIFMFEDITDSLDIKRENTTIQAVQKEIINNLVEGIMIFGSNNKLKSMNMAMSKILKIPSDSTAHISVVMEENKDNIEYLGSWEVYKSGIISMLTDRVMKTGKIILRNGSVIFYSYIPLPDGSHMHSFVDITDNCKVELAVHEKDKAIKIFDKLKYEFVSSLLSEIKDPMNIVTGFTNLLKQQYFGSMNPKQISYCDGIIDASEKMLDFMNNIKESYEDNIDNIKIRIDDFDIESAIADTLSVLKKRAYAEDIKLLLDYQSNVRHVHADKSLVKQAIYEIACNFMKYVRECEAIKINVIDENGKIKIIISALIPHFGDRSKAKAPGVILIKHAARVSMSEQINLGVPFLKGLIEKQNGALNIVKESNSINIILTLPTQNHQEDNESAA